MLSQADIIGATWDILGDFGFYKRSGVTRSDWHISRGKQLILESVTQLPNNPPACLAASFAFRVER